MTNQENINFRRYVTPKTLAVSMAMTFTLLAMMVIVTPISEQDINAQMITGRHESSGNMTSETPQHQQNMAINGTIDVERTIFEAIDSKINTSLIEAMTIAERSVGNNSSALAAFGNEQGGYFAYYIILGTPTMKFYNVLIDPGNGQILAKHETSKKELEQMHLEHSSEVVHGGRNVGGFPLLIPH